MKLLMAVIILACIYVVQKILYRKYWDKGLDTEVRFSRDYIECGESAELIEIVTNDKSLPLPVFHLKFSVSKCLEFIDRVNSSTTDLYHKNELFSILGHQRITRRLTFMGKARGVVNVNNASILVRDFFMTDTYAAKMKHSDVIYVFPPKLSTDRFHIFYMGIIGEIEAKRSLIPDYMTFRGIRQYQPSDPYKSINWKQSAKARELMVNVYGNSIDSRVRIMLNLDNDYMIETNKLLEEAISLVSSLSAQFLRRGIGVSVVTNGKNKSGKKLPDMKEGMDRQHAVSIDRMLTEIAGSEGKDYFLDQVRDELKKVSPNVLYLIISPYAKSDLIELLDEIIKNDGNVHLVVPYYDEYPFIADRMYAEGWEVPLNV